MTIPHEAGGKPLTLEAIRRRVEPGRARDDGSDPDAASGRRLGRVVVVYSPKGGAGCSTLAVNLAIVIRRRTGCETTLVDAALHLGEQDLLLNLSPRHGIVEVLAGASLDAALAMHPTGIRLLAGPDRAQTVDPGALEALVRRLAMASGTWSVVDTTPSLPDAAEAALSQADRILVPIFLDVAHLRRIKRDLANCGALRRAGDRLAFVAWNERTDVSVEAAGRILGSPILAELPFDPMSARRAINRGLPMVEADPGGRFARALARLSGTLFEPEVRSLVPTGPQGPLTRILDWLKFGGEAASYGA